MVHKEGEDVDQIVVNVTAVEMNTKLANKELESALAYQREINIIKRTPVGIAILAILVLVLFLHVSKGEQRIFTKGGDN